MSEKPSAVFWDMDGTIVDTEPLWMAAETHMVESFGHRWTHDDALQLVGNGLETSAEILRSAGVDLPVEEIIVTLTEQVSAALEAEGAPFRPGAVELMRSLADTGIPQGLVTMSRRSMADAVIAQLPEGVFEVVVSGDSARRPKPFPDPYLQAAEALQISTSDAVVIEDSPTGVRSAVASGAVTLGVPHFIALDGLGAHELWPTLDGRSAADIADLFVVYRDDASKGENR